MARNLGHARADGIANKNKNMSHCHKALKLQRLYYENRFKIPITSLVQCKTQIVHWKPISSKQNPSYPKKIVGFEAVILAVFKNIHGDSTLKETVWRRNENSATCSLKTPFCRNLQSVSTLFSANVNP